jgi:hypothetical protein
MAHLPPEQRLHAARTSALAFYAGLLSLSVTWPQPVAAAMHAAGGLRILMTRLAQMPGAQHAYAIVLPPLWLPSVASDVHAHVQADGCVAASGHTSPALQALLLAAACPSPTAQAVVQLSCERFLAADTSSAAALAPAALRTLRHAAIVALGHTDGVGAAAFASCVAAASVVHALAGSPDAAAELLSFDEVASNPCECLMFAAVIAARPQSPSCSSAGESLGTPSTWHRALASGRWALAQLQASPDPQTAPVLTSHLTATASLLCALCGCWSTQPQRDAGLQALEEPLAEFAISMCAYAGAQRGKLLDWGLLLLSTVRAATSVERHSSLLVLAARTDQRSCKREAVFSLSAGRVLSQCLCWSLDIHSCASLHGCLPWHLDPQVQPKPIPQRFLKDSSDLRPPCTLRRCHAMRPAHVARPSYHSLKHV